jgi:hypothetical protein
VSDKIEALGVSCVALAPYGFYENQMATMCKSQGLASYGVHSPQEQVQSNANTDQRMCPEFWFLFLFLSHIPFPFLLKEK